MVTKGWKEGRKEGCSKTIKEPKCDIQPWSQEGIMALLSMAPHRYQVQTQKYLVDLLLFQGLEHPSLYKS